MSITHSEARKWIHLRSDASLTMHQKQALDIHLQTCAECRTYANEIFSMENVLRPLLQRQWKQQPLPLSIEPIISARTIKLSNNTLLATRIAAISVMILAFMVSAWQLAASSPTVPNPVLANIPSMPIPSTSTQLTGTVIGSQGCGHVSYMVNSGDTIARIADQYSVSVEEIMEVNALEDENVRTGQILTLPVCDSTPTGTVRPLTSTLTPNLHTITFTPGG